MTVYPDLMYTRFRGHVDTSTFGHMDTWMTGCPDPMYTWIRQAFHAILSGDLHTYAQTKSVRLSISPYPPMKQNGFLATFRIPQRPTIITFIIISGEAEDQGRLVIVWVVLAAKRTQADSHKIPTF